MESGINEKVNPRITKVNIGIRNPGKLTIYPLSLHDQIEMDDIIRGAIEKIASTTLSEVAFISAILQLIKDNIQTILKLATGKLDEEVLTVMKEIDNVQFIDIVNVIYEKNYKEAGKNVERLFGGTVEKMKKWLNLERQSPLSAKDIPDTDLSTSIKEALGKVESQENK
jgi:hypothetical protein